MPMGLRGFCCLSIGQMYLCLSYNPQTRIKNTSLFWYSFLILPQKIRHLPDAHHKYSITGRAVIGGKVSWSFSNRPAEDRPHACPKHGVSPQSSTQCSSRVRTLMSQSACIANNIYISLCFLAKPEKSLSILVTLKIFSAYSQNTNGRNNVQLEGIGNVLFAWEIAFLNRSHFHLLGFLTQGDGYTTPSYQNTF